jgi:hypothetical protein
MNKGLRKGPVVRIIKEDGMGLWGRHARHISLENKARGGNKENLGAEEKGNRASVEWGENMSRFCKRLRETEKSLDEFYRNRDEFELDMFK